MAIDPRINGWHNYTHHKRATIEDWDSGEVLSMTDDGGDSQYNPHLYADDAKRQELELRCLVEGTTIRETPNKRTAYLDLGHVVGACSGETTTYVFAECTSGFYHGRPISKQALKELGVSI